MDNSFSVSQAVFRIFFNADPDPALYLNADLDPGNHTNEIPDPGQTLPSQKVDLT
jgi:hypothetical protein